MNCGKAAREGALGCDLGTPFVNSSAPAEPQGRTHPPQWASSEQPPQAALSESKWKIENYGVARREIIECRPRDGKWNEHEIQFEVHSPSSIFNSPF